MMNLENDITKKVDATLESLNGLHRAEAPAFLFTRVQAALRAEDAFSPWERILQFIGKPSVAFGALLLILALNGSILAWKESLMGDHSTSQTREEFADEYNLAVNTFYDYENK